MLIVAGSTRIIIPTATPAAIVATTAILLPTRSHTCSELICSSIVAPDKRVREGLLIPYR